MKKPIKSNQELIEEFHLYGDDIINNASFRKLESYVQHGTTSTFEHVLVVAFESLKYVEVHHIKCDRKSLVRGALLHDYYLYDWHDRAIRPKCHGFKHAKIALSNAERDFELNKTEKQIIKRHMFPLNIVPPTKKEAFIVMMIDKICSYRETKKPSFYKELIMSLVHQA